MKAKPKPPKKKKPVLGEISRIIKHSEGNKTFPARNLELELKNVLLDLRTALDDRDKFAREAMGWRRLYKIFRKGIKPNAL